ncbi:MAG: hypothetical protein ACP5D7_17565 [Limnospira sp.]
MRSIISSSVYPIGGRIVSVISPPNTPIAIALIKGVAFFWAIGRSRQRRGGELTPEVGMKSRHLRSRSASV